MQISISDITRAIEDLISRSKDREAIASWASSVRNHEDQDNLDYFPAAAVEEIWGALEFLMGVDLLVEPGAYLHNHEDIEAFALAWHNSATRYLEAAVQPRSAYRGREIQLDDSSLVSIADIGRVAGMHDSIGDKHVKSQPYRAVIVLGLCRIDLIEPD